TPRISDLRPETYCIFTVTRIQFAHSIYSALYCPGPPFQLSAFPPSALIRTYPHPSGTNPHRDFFHFTLSQAYSRPTQVMSPSSRPFAFVSGSDFSFLLSTFRFS